MVAVGTRGDACSLTPADVVWVQEKALTSLHVPGGCFPSAVFQALIPHGHLALLYCRTVSEDVVPLLNITFDPVAAQGPGVCPS